MITNLFSLLQTHFPDKSPRTIAQTTTHVATKMFIYENPQLKNSLLFIICYFSSNEPEVPLLEWTQHSVLSSYSEEDQKILAEYFIQIDNELKLYPFSTKEIIGWIREVLN